MAETNKELIRELKQGGYLKSRILIDAFLNIDRADFVPKEYAGEAYGNYPLPIGFGQTISQPLTVAFMLELLQPRSGEKILEIGAGSGWQTAMLAQMVASDPEPLRYGAGKRPRAASLRGRQATSGGRVIGVERIPELAKMAERNLGKYGFVKNGVAKIILGDGSKGYAAGAPYDKIIAAAAGDAIPEEWKKQLKTGGRIVAPIGQSIVVLDKIGGDEFNKQEHHGFSFVPLIFDS